ncbi:MAG: putative rane protein [Clostridiales bacterium]|jgi:uncharacterized membrane protein YczE|nr:putative rane protein [Clostridiales bacterium]
MKKIQKFGEWAYVCGNIFVAIGVGMITKADLGMSMVAAPAYLISLKVNFLTFGMAEYVFQGFLLLVFCIVVRKFSWKYLLSFITALIYGGFLDLVLLIMENINPVTYLSRATFFAGGMLIAGTGIAFFFHTYLPLGVYELFVKGISEHYNINTSKFKIVYDYSSCVLALAMTFLFFGKIQGIGWGTVISALINGILIGCISKILEKYIDFSPATNWYKFFRV